MYCQHVSLQNFRNYVRLELNLAPQTTILYGDNAQGKTNLVEAIYFMATTKSFRTSSDRELVNWLTGNEEIPFARVVGRVQREHGGPLQVEIGFRVEPNRGSESDLLLDGEAGDGSQTIASAQKRIKINGLNKRAIDLIGQMNVVVFSPQDIDLIRGAPQGRRRYIDITISQVDPIYVRTLARYNKVLMNRNALLRRIREGKARPAELGFWDQELVKNGSYLILQRRQTIAELNALVRQIHPRLTGTPERMQLLYRSSIDLSSLPVPASVPSMVLTAAAETRASYNTGVANEESEQQQLGAITELFSADLRRWQSREVMQGVSLIGPHRDDVLFYVEQTNMNIYGSRGQQRTVAVALKLAETTFMRERTHAQPILLLDDILSELDAERRYHIMQAIAPDQQVILTAADLDPFTPQFLAGAQLLHVDAGTIHQAG